MNEAATGRHAIDLGETGMEQRQYLRNTVKAVASLGWHLLYFNDSHIICRPAYTPHETSIALTVSVSQGHAEIIVEHAAPYYADEQPVIGYASLLANAIHEVIKQEEENKRNLNPADRSPYGALVPSADYLITPAVVYINVAIWIAMIVSGISPLHPTTQSLYAWGGNHGPSVAAGQWWRLLTYMALHGGGMHLLMNTFALLYGGMYLEPLLGKVRFAAVYVLTGIVAGLASIWIHPYSVGVGASGAIFGIYGAMLAILTTNYLRKTWRTTLRRSLLLFVIYNLVMGLQGNTDNAAHIGGLISGLAIGYALYPGLKKGEKLPKQLKIIAFASAITIVLATATILVMRS